MSFVDNVSASRHAELLYLMRGKNQGKACWHYIMVNKQKLPMFKTKMNSAHIDLTEYGEILESGWGENPPEEIAARIKAQYS